MRGKKAKKIRKELFKRGISIKGEPYTKLQTGQIVSSTGRRMYQSVKRRNYEQEKYIAKRRIGK